MSELITCPECGGRGEIEPFWQSENEAGKEKNNLTLFLETIGLAEKKKEVQRYKTCPKCNGFGMIRNKIQG